MSQSSLTVAAIQLSSQDDVASNLAACQKWVERAAQAGARFIVLPENFAFFGADEPRVRLAEPLLATGAESAPIQRALSQWARELGITLVGGGMPTQSGDPSRPFNTAVVFGPEGRLVAHYHKVHLFDVALADGTVLSESAKTSAGASLSTVGVQGFEVGLSICYDVRFPELYRGLIDKGAEVIAVPAAFTLHTGKDHWTPLLQARAIESQSWVIAAGQWGQHPGGRRCYGHSMVIDPWGAIVAQSPDRPGFVLATIDHEYQKHVRESVPSLRHRRLR
jgi:predicted amidohydrolase